MSDLSFHSWEDIKSSDEEKRIHAKAHFSLLTSAGKEYVRHLLKEKGIFRG